jgi:hypothetical protein
LHRKANKVEVAEQIKTKVDVDEFRKSLDLIDACLTG